jgi:hypothetical protein
MLALHGLARSTVYPDCSGWAIEGSWRAMEVSLTIEPTAVQSESVRKPSDKVFDLLFSCFIFVTIFLPSGSLYKLNFKYPLYLLLLPFAFAKFLRRGTAALKLLGMICWCSSLVFLWLLLGLINSFPAAGVVRQALDLFLTFLLCWLVYVFCNDQEANRQRFLRLALNSEIATCFFKIAMIAYAFAKGIPVVEVVKAVSLAFGVELMTMDLGAMFGRVQFVSDAIIPVCIYIVLRYRQRLGIGSLRASAMIILLLVSVIFSFSRYFWGYAAVALLAGVLLGKRDRFKVIVLTAIAGLVLASLPVLVTLYQLRFAEAVAGSSDEDRIVQSKALKSFFWDAPFVGHGLGSYTNLVIRSTEGEASRFGYEMQLLALVGQIGLIGVAFLGCLLVWYYRRIVSGDNLYFRDRLALSILLGMWLAAGLYNPLLLSPVASVSYASLAVMTHLSRETRTEHQGPTDQAQSS